MCKCHFYNRETKKHERVPGIFTLKTCNVGDVFKFGHEDFKRQVININFKASELFAPPIDNYTGMGERCEHTFHLSFKATF